MPLAIHACDENSTAAVNVDAKGLGLNGHDPVDCGTADAATVGKTEFSAKHDGVTYLFASAAHRDAFHASPAKYAPQFGGFCAMGVALEKKLNDDPAAWTIAGDRLYRNVNKACRRSTCRTSPATTKRPTPTGRRSATRRRSH